MSRVSPNIRDCLNPSQSSTGIILISLLVGSIIIAGVAGYFLNTGNGNGNGNGTNTTTCNGCPYPRPTINISINIPTDFNVTIYNNDSTDDRLFTTVEGTPNTENLLNDQWYFQKFEVYSDKILGDLVLGGIEGDGILNITIWNATQISSVLKPHECLYSKLLVPDEARLYQNFILLRNLNLSITDHNTWGFTYYIGFCSNNIAGKEKYIDVEFKSAITTNTAFKNATDDLVLQNFKGTNCEFFFDLTFINPNFEMTQEFSGFTTMGLIQVGLSTAMVDNTIKSYNLLLCDPMIYNEYNSSFLDNRPFNISTLFETNGINSSQQDFIIDTETNLRFGTELTWFGICLTEGFITYYNDDMDNIGLDMSMGFENPNKNYPIFELNNAYDITIERINIYESIPINYKVEDYTQYVAYYEIYFIINNTPFIMNWFGNGVKTDL